MLVGSLVMFFLGKDGKKCKVKMSVLLTNLDVLYAVHLTLLTCVMCEWHALGDGSHVQRCQKRL